MKLDGFPGVEVVTGVGTSGVPFAHAAFTMHAVSTMDETDVGDMASVAERAAEMAVMGAGLIAALRFNADILPFIDLAMHVIDGAAEDGRVSLIDYEDRVVEVSFARSVERLAVDEMAERLRVGAWRLP